MKFNICVVQPSGYIHSAAFSELAELIAYALSDRYHDARVRINHVAGNATNIIIGAHLLEPHLLHAIPGSSIILNTEQLWSESPSAWKDSIFHLSKSFQVWDYSELNIAKLESIGAKRCRHLRIGYHRKLRRLNRQANQDIDVLFYGSVNDRRREVLKSLTGRGLQTVAVFGVYGRERDALIERSKIVLNLHFYDSKIFEIVRVFYLLTNSKAVVAEVGPETHIDCDYLPGIRATSYEGLVDACAELVADDEARLRLEAAAFETISRLPQRELIAPLLD